MKAHTDDIRMREGFILWFTGLPSSGKTTLVRIMAYDLRNIGIKVELLDGDEVRKSLSPDLGFSKKDMEIHAQRVAYLCKLLSQRDSVDSVAHFAVQRVPQAGKGARRRQVSSKYGRNARLRRAWRGT